MNATETGFVEIGGQQIFYSIKGDGPPMVFVHGWTLNHTYWDAQVAHFSTQYRTYCYDWRGMGQSSGATPAFSMAQLGEELGGLISAFRIENPIICGHSEGGAIAAQYAATNPAAVRALVLADTDLNDAAEAILGTLGLALTEFFAYLELKSGHNPLVGMMPNLQRQLYSKNFIATHPEFIAAWQQQFLSNSLAGVINGLRAWDWRQDLATALKNFHAPTLLLWGLEDVMIRFGQMQRVQASLGGVSQLTTLARSGHMSPVEVPEQFNRVIQSFLDLNVTDAPPARQLPPPAVATAAVAAGVS
jgi:pimeloyl-ACP methyl ester carboxylesterase